MTITKADGSEYPVLSFAKAFRCWWCGHWKHDGCKVGKFATCKECVDKAMPSVLEFIAKQPAPPAQSDKAKVEYKGSWETP